MGAKERRVLYAKNFVFDPGANGKHKGEESHDQVCHSGSSRADVLREQGDRRT